MGKKQHFSNIPMNTSLNAYSSKEKANKKVVKFGEYNDFPSHLVDLYNNSSIHETCINAIVDAIKGDGLTAEPSYVLDKANGAGETWNDLYSKVALDYYLFGGFALEIIYNKLRTKVAEVYHIPFNHLRAKEANFRGIVEGYYLAENWDEVGKHNMDLSKCAYIPSYNYDKRNEEPSQIYYHKPYHPNQKYYPLPKYVGALQVAQLDISVDKWHTSNIKNGLTPSIAITTYTNGTDDDVRVIEQQLRENFAGEENSGQMFYMDVASREEKPDIEAIANNGSDTYYTTINDMVVQKVLTAHRITSPLLVGISQPGSLGNRDEMLDSYTLFLNMVIKPLQQDILRVFEVAIEKQYPLEDNIIIGVEQKQILDSGETEVDVITSKEAEGGEDAVLEDSIETAENEATL